jgi:hypothetical protein
VQQLLESFDALSEADKLWPTFHISAHGNQDGFALTGGEFVTWEILGQTLLAVARSISLFDRSGNYALIQVSLSTCKGFQAQKMFAKGPPYPCISVVGPQKEVEWSDSLTAFVVFFHLMMQKRFGIKEAVASMNRAAGVVDVFQFEMNPSSARLL